MIQVHRYLEALVGPACCTVCALILGYGFVFDCGANFTNSSMTHFIIRVPCRPKIVEHRLSFFGCPRISSRWQMPSEIVFGYHLRCSPTSLVVSGYLHGIVEYRSASLVYRHVRLVHCRIISDHLSAVCASCKVARVWSAVAHTSSEISLIW